MAEALVTVKLSPREFKLVQTALKVAELECGMAAQNDPNPRNKQASRQEQAAFAELHAKLTS